MILFGDLNDQNRNRAMKNTNDISGRAASIGVRSFPVFSLYDLKENYFIKCGLKRWLDLCHRTYIHCK